MSPEKPHKSHTALTYELLRDWILQSRFAPGEKLRIEKLCKTFEASSGAVREALSRLTAEGLVIAKPQKGFVVSPISRKDLIDLSEVRISVETRCLTESIEKGDGEWEGRVLSLAHQLSRLPGAANRPGTEDGYKWHKLHEQFHNELVAACTNSWWLHIRQLLYLQSERYRRLSGPTELDPQDNVDRDIEAEHNAIAEATIARDTLAACERLTDHLERTTRILLASQLPFSDNEPAA